MIAKAHQSSLTARWIGPIGSATLLMALVGALGSAGAVDATPDVPVAAVRFSQVAGVLSVILTGGIVAGVYALSALGLGRLLTPLWKGSASGLWLQGAAGVALMLWSAHLMGVAGLLSGHRGVYGAWGLLLLGLVLLADQVVRGELRPEKWSIVPGWVMLGVPALAVMLTAAACPPGYLWKSEMGGYDVLSYHLMLPREWGESAGRLRPLDHNVYSYLPSYMEAAYLHIGAIARAFDPRSTTTLVDGQGIGAMACQMLHALMGVGMGLLTGRAAWTILRRARQKGNGTTSTANAESLRIDRFGAFVGGAAAMSVPWVVVVGSMAYNELAVCLLGAGALIAAADAGLSPSKRGVLCGLLVGAACSAKPTAMLLVAPWVGLPLLALLPTRRWPAAIVCGSAAAIAMMAPWLVRNWAACGNPLFPFGAGYLGTGHWTAEQLGRYSGAHQVPMGVFDRVRQLVSVERGLLHPQWSLFAVETVVAAAAACWWRLTRRPACAIAAGLVVCLIAWLFATHLQSRFLIPLAVPGSVLLAIAVAWVSSAAATRAEASVPLQRAITLACAALPIALAARASLLFIEERDGRPNALTADGVSAMTGAAVDALLQQADDDAREGFLARVASPSHYANLAIDRDKTVYMLGDSTPLYYLGRVLYHTTWDTSPLGEAIRAHPDDPDTWTRALRSRGVEYVLVNFAELQRLIDKDHWYDPAVTRTLVDSWLRRAGEPVRVWQESNQVLVRLGDGTGERGTRMGSTGGPGAGTP